MTKRQRKHQPSPEVVKAFLAQLSHALQQAKGERSALNTSDETGINRQKLTDLEKKAKLTQLSPEELLALDSLLGGKLGGLLHDLRGTSVVDLLCEAGGVTFILGARELAWADHVSRWDVRAMTTILRSVQGRPMDAPEFVVEDALHVAPNGLHSDAYLDALRKERWFGLLDQLDGHAIVVLGSPRACHAAEYMLASIFGEEPFSTPKGALPFEFSWSKELHDWLPSVFARAGERDDAYTPRSGILGMRIGKTEYAIDDRLPTWSTYGIGVVQRRKSGQLWVVIAGATGTATSAVAEVLSDVRGILPPSSQSEDSAPLWFAVEALVQREGERGGDNRVVTSRRILGEPLLWDRVNRNSSGPPRLKRRV